MWSRWQKASGRSLGRRLIAGLTLAAYLAAAVGFPLPARARTKGGPPFPCQNNPCGCQSAEQCWQHCCCYTVEERWAWARANHVEPPPYAAKPSGGGWRTVRLRDRAAAADHPAGCPCRAAAAETVSGCTHCAPAPAAKSCCKKKPKAAPRRTTRGVRLALGLTTNHCRGNATLWVGTGAVLPAVPQPSWQPFVTPQGWLPFTNVRARDELGPPPAPPPRSFAV
jgi:hypothetical protein